MACARREVREEIGTDVEIASAPMTWHIPRDGPIRQLEVTDRPRPFAFYEMVHPPGTPLSGQVYPIVIYRARLHGIPRDLPRDELQGVIALTPELMRSTWTSYSERCDGSRSTEMVFRLSFSRLSPCRLGCIATA